MKIFCFKICILFRKLVGFPLSLAKTKLLINKATNRSASSITMEINLLNVLFHPTLHDLYGK